MQVRRLFMIGFPKTHQRIDFAARKHVIQRSYNYYSLFLYADFTPNMDKREDALTPKRADHNSGRTFRRVPIRTRIYCRFSVVASQGVLHTPGR